MDSFSPSNEAGPSRLTPSSTPVHGQLDDRSTRQHHQGDAAGNVNSAFADEDSSAKPAFRDLSSTGQSSRHHLETGQSARDDEAPDPPKHLDNTPTHRQQRRTTPPRAKLPSVSDRRRARDMASALLRLTRCAECDRPLTEPVTLPCGHSACMQCIRNRCQSSSTTASTSATPWRDEEEEELPLPCTTHIPPRLPLSPMTVSCPVSGCPRSAIGRGMGRWSGHRPRYGLVPSCNERLPNEAQDVGPGSPPLDGFVVGVADHPHRLTVVGPQCRSKAHLFAVPPVGVETTASSSNAAASAATLLPSLANSNLLRLDVSLSKVIAILKRYVATPIPRTSRARRSPRSPLRSRAGRLSRRRNATGLGRGIVFERRSLAAARGRRGGTSMASGSVPSAHGLGRRGRGGRTTIAGFGTTESDLESGTVGGVRAASESESDDDFADEDDIDDLYAEEGEGGGYDDVVEGSEYDSNQEDDLDDDGGYSARFRSGFDDEGEEDPGALWPDGVGGAFNRPLASASTSSNAAGSRAQRKRRRARSSFWLRDAERSPETTLDALRHGPTRRLYDESDARLADSGWNTEDSARNDATTSERVDQQPSASTSQTESRPGIPAAAAGGDSLSTKMGPTGEPLLQTVATLHAELLEVLECQLCYLFLYQPLTTPCGHTFCRSCFARSLDHGNRCPLCRAEMPNVTFFSEHPCNSALLRILTADTATLSDEDDSGADAAGAAARHDEAGVLPDAAAAATASGLVDSSDVKPVVTAPRSPLDGEKNPHHLGFKQLYDNRKSVIEQEEREARLSTPLFICTLAFPQMPTILHIFEPRYRLMVRRCLESGSPRFGMVLPSRNNGGLDEYGTMLEIKSVQMLNDGRSMLETVGSYRFKVLDKGTLDGYTVGRIERVDDISLEEEAELERAAMVRRRALERAAAQSAAAGPGGRPDSANAASDVPDNTDATRADSTAASRSTHSANVEAIRSSAPPASADDADHVDDSMALYQRSEGTTVAASDMRRGGSTATEQTENSESTHDLMLAPFLPVPQEPTIDELVDICRSFIETLRSESAPWLLSRLNHAYGPMPEAHEVERLGYWMALVMPIDEHEKAKLLPIRSRRMRLCLVVDWIEQLRRSWWFTNGCTVS